MWTAASEAVAMHKGNQEVAVIVNLGHFAAVLASAGLLQLAWWSRKELALAGAHPSITATSRSSQWVLVEPGPVLIVWPLGFRLLLRWCTNDAPEDRPPQPLASVVAGTNVGVTRLYRAWSKMEVDNGLPPNRTKADATRWG